MIRSQILTQTDKSYESRDFGLVDRFGRSIGAAVDKSTVVYAEYTKPEGQTFGFIGYDIAPGTYLEFSPTATRDGSSYGASQPRRRFTGEHAYQAAIEKYFADAKKRALANKAFTKA